MGQDILPRLQGHHWEWSGLQMGFTTINYTAMLITPGVGIFIPSRDQG